MKLRNAFAATICFFCAPVAAQQQSPVTETTMEKWAKQAGFTQCRKTVEEIGRFLVGKNTYTSHDFTHKANANRHMLSSVVVKHYSDGGAHINFAVAPVTSGSCNWTYTETSIYEKACQLVRDQSFGNLKYFGEANGNSVALTNEKGLYYYLTPSESGKNCLVTKREVVIAE